MTNLTYPIVEIGAPDMDAACKKYEEMPVGWPMYWSRDGRFFPKPISGATFQYDGDRPVSFSIPASP
jgi:hypothetical protein